MGITAVIGTLVTDFDPAGRRKGARGARARRPSAPVREVRDERDLVQVAPAPRLARLRRAHDRVVRLVEVLGRVAVRRVVAAADLPALPAEAQVNPRRPDLQALLASVDPL